MTKDKFTYGIHTRLFAKYILQCMLYIYILNEPYIFFVAISFNIHLN